MRSPIPDYLSEVLAAVAPDRSGAVADYIPELACVDPEPLGVAVSTVDGTIYGAGAMNTPFTIQSISKPFVYALALADRGLDAVLEKVDVEPSGEAFNELSLEELSGRPLNPMINAGAIAVHTLVGEHPSGDRSDRILAGLSAFAGRDLDIDKAAYRSETATAFRNYAIANMLRSQESILEAPADVVAAYTRQCSILVTAGDLAVMAATLANRGVHPVTGEQVVEEWVVRQVLSVMTTCGMYDPAGDWISSVGFPAKSGVPGGILGALPGQFGLAAYSPRLDRHGSSVRGVDVFRRLSADMGLHMMDPPQPARATIRRVHSLEHPDGSSATVFSLHGSLQFAGAERLLRDLFEAPELATDLVIDLSRVHSINSVARWMLLKTMRRLHEDGHCLVLVDPDTVLPDPDCGGGVRPTVVDSVTEAAGA